MGALLQMGKLAAVRESGGDTLLRVARTPRWRAVDVLLLLAPLLVLGALTAFVRADPAPNVTSSNGLYTDEAWNLINARNFVLLGSFSTDDWNLHLVNVPFSLIQATVFSLVGVGMSQARMVSIVAVALTMGVLGLGLRARLGGGAAMLASLAYGTSALVLYYGRLAFLEPTVACALTIGALLVVRANDERAGRWGLVAGVALAIAIGTKPSAAFAAGGILAAAVFLAIRSTAARRWLSGAVLAITFAGVAWILLIGLPNWTAVATDLRIWASEPIIGPLDSIAGRILSFPVRNDGFLVTAAPIILFGALGWVAAVRRRRGMSDTQFALFAMATGWLTAGLGILALAPYRPNRYEVPLLPALAILGALGWSLAGPRLHRMRPMQTAAIGVAVAAVVVAPGAMQYASWMVNARQVLIDTQARVAAILPAGAVVEGRYAPGFALQAPVVTLVSRVSTRVNPGDLYVTRGVRWYIDIPGSVPSWARLHARQWSARVVRLCVPWSTDEVCLWQVP